MERENGRNCFQATAGQDDRVALCEEGRHVLPLTLVVGQVLVRVGLVALYYEGQFGQGRIISDTYFDATETLESLELCGLDGSYQRSYFHGLSL